MGNHTRVWHYLPGNARSATPSNLIFADTETIPDDTTDDMTHTQHRLRLWVAIALRLEDGKVTRRVVQRGRTAEEFWLWVQSRCSGSRPVWLWFHKASFDLSALSFAGTIESGRFSWEQSTVTSATENSTEMRRSWQGCIVIDDPPTIIELRIGDTTKKLIIVDTLNYWRCSLKELGESVGIPKRLMPPWNESDERWYDHCENDCSIIERAVCGLIETVRKHDLGNFRYTAPSMGLQAFRHRFMDHKILVHCDENALRLERLSYFGGQCSIYRRGIVQGPIHVLDYQSFYPSVMSRFHIPYHLRGSLDRPPVAPVAELAKRFYCIAEVGIKSDKETYPVRYRGHTVSARGKFKTVLHHGELIKAINRHHVNGVYAIAWYSADVLFKRFVDELWQLRQQATLFGDRVQADMLKLVMNGLHGKFGQKQIKWVDETGMQAPLSWGTYHELDGRTGQTTAYRSLAWRVQRKRDIGEHVNSPYIHADVDSGNTPAVNDESVHSCPSIAGSITSWGRLVLNELVEIAGQENVYYTDTDCVHVNAEGYKNIIARKLIVRDELGKLSIKKVAKEAEYLGLKYYRLDDDWTIAGIKSNARKLGPNLYRQVAFTGFQSMLYNGVDGGLWQSPMDVDRSDFQLNGNLRQDGIVESLTLNE